MASHEDLLWVCAALSDADRAAARMAPGGLFGLDGTPGGSEVRMLDIPAATFNRAYNTVANSVLWFVHHMLYDTPNQPAVRAGIPPRLGGLPRIQPGLRHRRSPNHAARVTRMSARSSRTIT